MKFLIWLYRKIFCRAVFFQFNRRVSDLCLRGIGVLNYEGYGISGEKWFIEVFLRDKAIATIVDVGANVDPYGIDIPGVTVYALEPNRSTFIKLQKAMKNHSNILCYPLGLSDKKGKSVLYDVSKKGSALASLDKNAITKIHGAKAVQSSIELTTLDAFVKSEKISQIDLLKIDTEGNEYKVLLGAKQTLTSKHVRFILFEFNEMNVYSRVFLNDFYQLLEGYTFYRLLPDGLGKLGPYRPITHELFAFQNIVAIRDE